MTPGSEASQLKRGGSRGLPAIFWFNLAFRTAALALGAAVLPESAGPDAHRVDIVGAVLGAAASSALSFAVISAETAGFAAPDVIALLSLRRIYGDLGHPG